MKTQIDFTKRNYYLKLFKVLSNANRLKILECLIKYEEKGITSGNLAEEVGIDESNLSNHLKLMRISKIVTAKQEGSYMRYFLREPIIKNLIGYI